MKNTFIVVLTSTILVLYSSFVKGQSIDSLFLYQLEHVLSTEVSLTKEVVFYSNELRREDKHSVFANTLLSFLLKVESVGVELRFHTDCLGKSTFNKALSQRRANQMEKWLVVNGVLENKILAEGYGEEELMYCEDCECSDFLHRKNNRIEILLLKN